MKAPLSAVLITRNAANVLDPCLESLAFADEIVIVDSGSSDRTPEIARERGARVVQKEWLGFGRQKQFAVEQAKHDWVLCVDADERVSPGLAAGIQAALAAPVSPVYRMPRRNRFLGRWLAHGEGYPDWSPRLFNRQNARWSDDLVHEKVLYAVTPGTLAGDLMHDSADDLSAYLERQNRYTTLAARQAFEQGRGAGLFHLLLSPVVRFIKFYLLRLGFLDGVPGLLHISIGCMNSYLKYAKLIELRRAEKQAVKVLITGVAGFIGMHCAQRLLERGDEVLGVDNFSPYYAVELKKARLALLEGKRGFRFSQLDISDAGELSNLFAKEKPDAVLNLAAQPGVRYSLENPAAYVQANLVGFANILESCRAHPPQNLVFASSSSVYGSNEKLPWSESDNVDRPISLYAATKKSNELMAHVYSHLYRLPVTGLRYFTVYGPWGRPDMSPVLFARAIMEGRPIAVFNRGDMQRDFTYVDDIVEGTLRVLARPTPYAVYNIGNHTPVALLDYIAALEKVLGRKARLEMKPMQPGDVKATYADTAALRNAVGFAPSTPLETGLARFAQWFKSYYGYA